VEWIELYLATLPLACVIFGYLAETDREHPLVVVGYACIWPLFLYAVAGAVLYRLTHSRQRKEGK